jgi:hypothetical protein
MNATLLNDAAHAETFDAMWKARISEYQDIVLVVTELLCTMQCLESA